MSDESERIGKGGERTRGTAFSVLLEEFRSARRSLDNEEPGKSILTENLLREIFRSAWKNQFDDERSAFRSEVREIVQDSVQAAELDEDGGL